MKSEDFWHSRLYHPYYGTYDMFRQFNTSGGQLPTNVVLVF